MIHHFAAVVGLKVCSVHDTEH